MGDGGGKVVAVVDDDAGVVVVVVVCGVGRSSFGGAIKGGFIIKSPPKSRIIWCICSFRS